MADISNLYFCIHKKRIKEIAKILNKDSFDIHELSEKKSEFSEKEWSELILLLNVDSLKKLNSYL